MTNRKLDPLLQLRSMHPAPASKSATCAVVLNLLFAAACALPAHGQQLEPRAYSNAPIGVNFMSLGYAWSDGNVLLDPALPIENLEAEMHVGIFQVSHAFSLLGDNAKVKFALPWADSEWAGALEGIQEGQIERGVGDAWVGLDWLFSGAPALTLTQFPQYRPTRVYGIGLRLSVPTGDYDPSELLNLGSNRWSLRTEISASETFDRWTLEGIAGVRIFTDNNDFLETLTLAQEPLWSLKGSVIYSLARPGWWTSFSVAYGEGGRSLVDRVAKNTKQRNWRFGANFSLPLADRHGLSIRVNTGINEGAGGDFDSVSLVYTFQTTSKAGKNKADLTNLAARDQTFESLSNGHDFSNTNLGFEQIVSK